MKSLQKDQNSTNLLLWPPICWNKPAITPKWFNSLNTNSRIRAKNCDVFWQKILTLTSDFSSLKNSNNLSEEIGGFTIYLGFTYLHTNSANHFWKTPKMEVEQRQIVRRRHLHSLWQNGYHVWHSRHQFAPWLQADFPLFLSRHRLQKKMFQFDDFFGFFCKSKQSAVLSTNRVNRRVLQILIHT